MYACVLSVLWCVGIHAQPARGLAPLAPLPEESLVQASLLTLLLLLLELAGWVVMVRGDDGW